MGVQPPMDQSRVNAILARASAPEPQPHHESSPLEHLDNTDDVFLGQPGDQDTFYDTLEDQWNDEDAAAAYMPVPESVNGSHDTATSGDQDVPTWTDTYVDQAPCDNLEGLGEGTISDKVRCAPHVHAHPEHLARRHVVTSLAVLCANHLQP